MPKSALPLHLQNIEVNFPDDDQYKDVWFGSLYRWYQKKTKTWFAFSYRCTEWWGRWRVVPKTLLIFGGEGTWRIEQTYKRFASSALFIGPIYYLSRVQYYKRWSFIIQWPLMISFHFYPKASDVPNPYQSLPTTDGKVWFFFWGHYDADNIYWMFTSIFLGRCWK